ncbi:serine hydrolase domain-containing protein [Rubripirellula reticaptiva]|uniref:Esterase EstB n=1 Tax=Rubripirellula reticaptiva TaxID=2528013 RepID=A0A5C6FDH0_9BACT|nr:serine hydrolase domain-containing protein [Rubripirellula reticaptiva]TWU58116.1 Esterase EstB [Rubripirellula reticaptiva]
MLSSFSASADDLPVARPGDVGMSASKLAEVDAAMEESIAQNRIAGGVVMVARNGKVVHHQAYGKRDIEADLPMQSDTIVRIYSMTKAITTAAAMMLVEEGKIEVNDPVSKYLPELAEVVVAVDGKVKPAERTMTVADLMRHTAGYSYGATGNATSDQVFRKLNIMDRDATLAQLQTKLGELPLVFEPGSDWLYGISVDVLGRVVEVVSQQPLDEFFQQRIFEPLGMEDTGFFVPADKAARFAANYNSDGKGKLTLGDDPKTSRYHDDPAFLSGGGGLVSTAGDYMRFLLMIAGGGASGGVQLMKPETVAMMTTNQLPKDVGWIKFGKEVRNGVGFGFGFNVREEMSDWDPSGRVGEYGWGGAASTHYWVSPKDNLIVITLEQVMPYQWLTELKVKGIIYDAIEN